jgi:macrolide transport system ATP-binding/permease protein
VLELATAMVLLAGAGLLSRSLHQLLNVELGFNPDRVATIGVAAPQATYGEGERALALGRRVVSRVARLPAVESVALTSLVPVTFNGNTDWIRFVGRPYNGEHNEVNMREVSADYFTTLRAALLRGRSFTDADDLTKPRVAIINRRLAALYFPAEDPIGKRIGDTSLSPDSIKEIIGVVDDIREGPLDSEIWPAVYYPFNQSPGANFSVVARTSPGHASILPALSTAIREIDPDIAAMDGTTMETYIHDSRRAYLHRSSTWLVGSFAAIALLLGVIGLYGVVAYSVAQRTREIGVRMALGARTASVYRLVVGEAGRLAAIGIAAGLACAVGAASLMRELLFGTPPWDPLTLAVVAALLGGAALASSYFPARRAASVNPMDALRTE